MSEIIAFPLPAGPNYTIPDVGEINWGQAVTDFLIAIPQGVPPTAGTFMLTGDLSFGPTFGLVPKYLTSITSNPAHAGFVRLAKTDTISWRNNLGSADLALSIDGSDNLLYNGIPISAAPGVTSITGTANQIIASAPTGNVTLSTPQNIAPASSPTFAGLTLSGVTANRALASGGSSNIVASATTDTELGYVSGVTSAIQTQLDAKQATGNYITALTGDVAASGPGSAAATLATVNSNVGSFTFANVTVNAKGLITAASNGAANFIAPTVQVFTSGSGTYTLPTSPRSPIYLHVRMIGAGGGGSGSGTSSGGTGGNGSNTTFGSSFLTANGGTGGTWASPSGTGGAGGSASIGVGASGITQTGAGGGGSSINNANADLAGAAGAGSPFSGPTISGANNTAGASGIGNSGVGGQGGGTGAVNTITTGTGGGAGGYIDVIVINLLATYSYSVGGGGGMGTAGPSGFNGGAGGNGIIIVEEYYQ